jgi:hypothetical protein
MPVPKKPVYTPEQLIKKGLFTAGKLLMMLFMKSNSKPSQENQRRGGNAQAGDQVLVKLKNQPDGTTKAEEVRVRAVATDINKILYNPKYRGQIEFQEYIGPYHTYPNGAVYSGAEYSDASIHLMPYSPQIDPAPRYDELVSPNKFSQQSLQSEDTEIAKPVRSENNTIYYQLTKRRYDLHTNPEAFYHWPDEQDYERGQFTRFFVQRINDEADITEVSGDEYAKINRSNSPGIDGGLYRGIELNWTIDGPPAEVRKANESVILDRRYDMPGITNFLTDLEEYHKLKEREFTPAEEYFLEKRHYPDGEEIHPRLPKSYALPREDDGIYGQNCGNCWFRENNACNKWRGNVRNAYWCKSWKNLQGIAGGPPITHADQQAAEERARLQAMEAQRREERRRRRLEEEFRRREILRRAEETGENTIIQPPADEGEQSLPDVFAPPPPSPPYPPPPGLTAEEREARRRERIRQQLREGLGFFGGG